MSQLLSEFWLQIFITFAITAIASLSLYICFIGGQFSLGHGSLMAAGAYSAALVSIKTDLPFAVSLGSAVLAGAAVGGVMGLMALRIQEFYLAIGTLAFGAAAIVIVINNDTLGGPTGLVGISLDTTGNVALVMLVAATLVVLAVRHSRFGRALLALREDHRLAATVGVRVWLLKLGCFGISGAIAGLAGGLLAHNLAIVRPENFELQLSLSFWVTVIVGGTATVAGPLIGSVIVVLLTEWLSSKVKIDHLYIEGGLLVLAMLVRPNGLIGTGDIRRVWNLVASRNPKAITALDDEGADPVAVTRSHDEPRASTALEVGQK
jgi:branched-chain amino acid transport system permease protein